jgi:hypothetical protein
MNEITLLRNKQINDFMAGFIDLNEVNVKEIQEGLKNIIGETPGVDFEYGVDFQLNEDTGDEDRLEELKKIHIYYTYIDENVNMPKIGKISYVVG